MGFLSNIFPPLLVFLTALSQINQVSAAATITDLFDISFDSSVPGNCADYSETILNGLLTDAITLSRAGQSAAQDMLSGESTTSDQALRLLSAFFINPESSQVDTIRKRYKAVYTWLRKGGNVVYNQISAKPYLFCGDFWTIRQDMSSQMRDVNGDLMTKEDGTSYLLSDDADSVKKQKAVAKADGTDVSAIYPYYSSRAGIYTFGKKYGKDPTDGFCANSNAKGYTDWSLSSKAALVVLCPSSFTNTAIRSVTATPFSESLLVDDTPPSNIATQKIRDVVPGAETFFHETFHLLLGDKMTPSGGEEYDAARMMGQKLRANGKTYKQSSALENPQSYVFTAVAYDYTQHVTQTVGKNAIPIEFYTGYCTYKSS